MKDPLWTVVDGLVGAALEREPHERAAFLRGACGGDAELRREVESLLAHDRDAGDFLEPPELDLVGRAPTSPRRPLSADRELGPYRVLDLLGSGGMGDVYRARDTRLKRDVALKILPDSFAEDPERLVRFRREAEILASLNDPHIAGIHGVEESGGRWALVLELVEGETLAERIARGPIPLIEALTVSEQILEALDTAHEQGITHRDLKPANIKITPDGLVKVLDFGLAKLTHASGVERAFDAGAISPTRSAATLTREGIILGTAAYMAPEQAIGKAVDRRADVWAFGAVLYEMLAGRRAFAGQDVQQTLAAVLRDKPDWSALPGNTPPRIRLLIELCLEKDVKRRVRDIATVRLIMAGTFETSPTGEHPRLIVRETHGWRRRLSWAAALAVASAVTLAVAWSVRPIARDPVARLVVPMARERLNPSRPVVSPNGEYLAYVWGAAGTRTLSLHRASDPDGPALAEFDGASYPFFSRDSAWLAFFAGRELKKVSVLGGPAQTLAAAAAGRGGSWGDDGRIVFAPSFRSGLARVSADGGDLEMLTAPDPQLDESGHRYPQVLPGSNSVIFTALRTRGPALVAASLKTGRWHTLVDGVWLGMYVPTGHLVYTQAGRLMAAPFDVERLAVAGAAVPFYETGDSSEVATFSVTDSGRLLYRSGLPAPSTLVWVDRGNVVTPLRRALRNFVHPRISPDGTRIVANSAENLWVYDLARDQLSQLTFQHGQTPVWMPNGREIIYGRPRTGTGWDIFQKPWDNSGSEQGLVTKPLDQVPSGGNPSADGQFLAYSETSLDTAADIRILSMKDGSDSIFLKTSANEMNGTFSPDARYVAYVSNSLGKDDVFIRPLTGPGDARRVSVDGGVEPHWAPNGELFFRNGDQMLVVNVTTRPDLVVGSPRTLFRGSYALSPIQDRNYDVTADGKRFLMVRQGDPTDGPVRLNLVVNWFEDLRGKVR